MPTTDHGRTLVISDGGVGSVLACVIAREALYAAPPKGAPKGSRRPDPADARPLVWAPPFSTLSATARLKAIKRQCDLLNLEFVDSLPTDAYPPEAAAGERATRDLVNAAYAALHRGASRVVWPVHFDTRGEPDLPSVSDALDRAVLVSRAVALDGGLSVSIDAPFADFTDRQLAELVIDIDAPVKTCWWWHAQLAKYDQPGAEALPPGLDEFRAEYRRWTGALAGAGWAFELAGA